MNSSIRHPYNTDGDVAPMAMLQVLPVRFHVYKNARFQGETAFRQNHIAIGSSPDADLVLDHQTVAAFHAFVYVNDGHIFLSNKYPHDGLRLNGNSVKEAEIQPDNIIDIGPFSMHIKLGEQDPEAATDGAVGSRPVEKNLSPEHEQAGEADAHTSYSVILINRYRREADRQQAAGQLARFVRAEMAVILAALRKPTLAIKKQLPHRDALRLQDTIQSLGLPCFVQEDISSVEMRTTAPETAQRPDSAPTPEGRPITPARIDGRHQRLDAARPPEVIDEKAVAEIDEPFEPLSRAASGEDTGQSDEPGEINSETSTVTEAKPAVDNHLQQSPPALEEKPVSPGPEEINFSDIAAELSQITSAEVNEAPSFGRIKDEAYSGGLDDEALALEDDGGPEFIDPDPGRTNSFEPSEFSLSPESTDADGGGRENTDLQADIIETASLGNNAEDVTLEMDQHGLVESDEIIDSQVTGEVEASDIIGDGVSMSRSAVLPDDEADEEDDEGIWEAPFSLCDQLTGLTPDGPSPSNAAAQVHVVKTVGGVVMDAGVVKQGRNYTIPTDHGDFVLAENKSRKDAHVYFNGHLGGYTIKNGQVQADLSSFKTQDYLHHKKKGIYRLPLDQDSIVVVEDGECQYRLFRTYESPEPRLDLSSLPAEVLPSAWNWRHWAGSFAFHAALVLCLIIYGFLQTIPTKDDQLRFVKIDTTMLDQLQAMKKPVEKPKPPAPQPKPEPVKVAEKVTQPEKKTVAKAQPKATPHKTASRKSGASRKEPSRDPNAGGGFGEGNIKNRNINQTGLLSLLSNTDLGGPSEAIAAVTNIDAVKVPGATEKNFTVGGIKGSLGNGKISVTSPSASGGGTMLTKGDRQVLRSAGASGPGTVAAMEKGKTGNRQVQAMVTAKVNREVKIEGGMSREMVKRVIDQHMEEITYCYESALMVNPSIMGRVVFEWRILMSGDVGEIRIVNSSLNSNEIHNCIKSAIKTWQFPKPVGSEVVVSFPFVFDLVAF